MLILKTLALESQHGWAIAQRIRRLSGETLLVPQGSLYPSLYRLERGGWIRSYWGESENRRRSKFYALTASGRRRLEKEQVNWERLSGGIALVLKTT